MTEEQRRQVITDYFTNDPPEGELPKPVQAAIVEEVLETFGAVRRIADALTLIAARGNW